MKNLFLSVALTLAALASNSPNAAASSGVDAPIGPRRIIVTARFTPNAILAGAATTFSWTAPGAGFCDIEGVPGISFGGASGSIALNPTSSLQAALTCEGGDRIGFGSASLTVQSADTPPVVNVSFSPASIYTGQSSTFSWSSQYATSCSSTGAVAVNGTAGSQVLTPASNQQVTVTCVGSGGQTSASANLTVSAAPPQVYAWASPSWLSSPSWVWIHWQSFNSTSCNYGGPNGSYYTYVPFTTAIWINCYGPGGVGSTVVWVQVSNFAASKDAAAVADVVDLQKLGIDLNANEVSHSRADFNKDGLDDLLVVDGSKREAYLLLNDVGRFTVINKTVADVGRLADITNVLVPAGKSQSIVLQVTR